MAKRSGMTIRTMVKQNLITAEENIEGKRRSNVLLKYSQGRYVTELN